MLIQTQGAAVLISAETADYLEKHAGLAGLRVKARGVRPQVAADLTDIREAAELHRRALPALPEERAGCPEVAAESEQWMTPTEVADMAMVTDKAVRVACREGRIAGRFVGGRWQIEKAEAARYAATHRR